MIVEIGADKFQVVNEGKGASLADLILDGIQHAQHQLRNVTHGCADITDDHDFGFHHPVPVVQLHGYAVILQVRAQCSFGI